MHTYTSLLKCSLNHAEADGPMPMRESTTVQKYSTCPEASCIHPSRNIFYLNLSRNIFCLHPFRNIFFFHPSQTLYLYHKLMLNTILQDLSFGEFSRRTNTVAAKQYLSSWRTCFFSWHASFHHNPIRNDITQASNSSKWTPRDTYSNVILYWCSKHKVQLRDYNLDLTTNSIFDTLSDTL